MRGALLLAVLLLAGCDTVREVEVPPAFNDSGIVITLKPQVWVGGLFGMETISGTVENRSGRDVDLVLCLNLVDDSGRIVGHAFAFEEDFRRGAKRGFEACAMEGPPGYFDHLFHPPRYSRVTRGFVWDQRAVERLCACLNRLFW